MNNSQGDYVFFTWFAAEHKISLNAWNLEKKIFHLWSQKNKEKQL